ncbi:kinesin-like protein KIN-5D, partial [Phalaenopsis equestris]|uniref:kinesin-like protein KIN-5D n=1 Tax=Phalaenopsis equestris TaxID=78828 RepID=UPI0009E1F853
MDEFQRNGGEVPMNLSDTTRSSEKLAEDFRFSIKNDKEKELNVQVILRCRPSSEEEEANFSMPAVITCNELRGEVLAIQNIGNKQIERSFAFDK